MKEQKRNFIRSKKAQEGFSYTMVLIITAVIILILAIVWIIYGNQIITKISGQLPNDLSVASTSCQQYLSLPGDAALINYCEYKPLSIDGKKQYVYCSFIYDRTAAIVGEGNVSFEKKYCAETPNTECNNLASNAAAAGNKFSDSTLVNGQTCKFWTNSSCKPKYSTTAEQCTALSKDQCTASAAANQCSFDITNNKCMLWNCTTLSDSSACAGDPTSARLCAWA